MDAISHFIQKLSGIRFGKSDHCHNFYFGESKEAKIKRRNLKLYLEKMKAVEPGLLLVGEAPGYKGCALTGVPFSSEKLLLTHPFFTGEGFQLIENGNSPESEQSATIVWEGLSQHTVKPLIWNSFPFHPFHPEKGHKSNRAPNKKELDKGKDFLLELIRIFPIEKIAAVGRKPEAVLKDTAHEYVYIRHPSRGGKKDFIQGIRMLNS